VTPLALQLDVRPVLGLPASAVLAVAFAALLAWTLWRRPPARRRRLLLALRLAAAAALALLLFRPELVWVGRRPVRGQVAILLDASSSMTISDVAGPSAGRSAPSGVAGVSRAAALRQAFLSSADVFGLLAERFVVRPYAFGSHLRPVGTLAPEPADGRTDPGEALAELADRSTSSLVAVVLIGDGVANREACAAPADAAARLRARGVRVHTVSVGSPEPSDRAADVAVRDLRAPVRVFVGNRAEVRARVAAIGLEGRRADLVLKVNGRVVEPRTLTFDSPAVVREVVFTPRLDEAGLARISLEAEPVPSPGRAAAGDLVASNNLAETIVRVDEGGLRVLYLDGSLRPEGKYLARALADAPELDLERRLLVHADGAPSPDDLDRFEVVLLGDLAADALPSVLVQRLADRVRQGRLGLVALGGLEAFGAGGWARTSLAPLLPFAVRDTDAQVPGKLQFLPTPEGRRHFILSRDGAEAQGRQGDQGFESLGLLPPLSGASAVGPLQPDAALLAAAADGTPLLAVRDNGTFRSASLTADSTWLWVLSSADPEGPARHADLWRRLVLWAARRDERPGADLAVLTDRTRYLLADADRPADVEVRVYARGAEAPPRVRATAPDGRTEDVPLAPVGENEWRAVLRAGAAGTWRLRAEAGSLAADAEFLIELQDFELAALLADHEALRALAEAGGGTFSPLDRLGPLLRELAAGGAEVSEPAERRAPLASGRIYLALVLALLSADWLLRRSPSGRPS